MKRPAIILAALLCMASRHPDRMIRSDLALNVSFNRGDASDRSMHNHTPTLSNGAVITAGNRYVTLDGTNDLVSFPDAAADLIGTAFTISAWINPSSPGSAGRSICGRYDTTTNKRSFFAVLRYDAGGTPYQLAMYDAEGDAISFLWNATLPTSGWTHVVYTYSGAANPNEAVCYVNGAVITLTSRTKDAGFVAGSGFRDTGEPLFVGSNNNVTTAQFPFKGNLDDVRIYTRALTAAEVAAIYSSGRE